MTFAYKMGSRLALAFILGGLSAYVAANLTMYGYLKRVASKATVAPKESGASTASPTSAGSTVTCDPTTWPAREALSKLSQKDRDAFFAQLASYSLSVQEEMWKTDKMLRGMVLGVGIGTGAAVFAAVMLGGMWMDRVYKY